MIGASKDGLAALERSAAKHGPSFPLAPDASGVAEAYGAWVEESRYGKRRMGVDRSAVLVDAAGRVARIWRKLRVDRHAAEVLAAARALGDRELGDSAGSHARTHARTGTTGA